MDRLTEVPNEITLVYREVGGTHVFTAPNFKGLHIGSSDLKNAYSLVPVALSEHVSSVCSQESEYVLSMPFEQFESHLTSGSIMDSIVIARKSLASRSEIRPSA